MEDFKSVMGYICKVDVNSTKAEFIREYNSWFMTDDIDRIMAVMDDEIVWEMVGDITVEGKQAVREMLTKLPEGEEKMDMIEERVDGILVDGLLGSSFGTVIMANGESYAFNDVLQFKDSEEIKIKKVKTFMIKFKS